MGEFNKQSNEKMKKSDIMVMPEYFERYIGLVEDIELSDAFKKSVNELDALDFARIKRLGDAVYAPGKWSVKDIFQHLIDTERIFGYRALRFARKDDTPLPGFDDNEYAVCASATRRGLDSIIDELKAVRISNACMFGSFNHEMLQCVGICWNKQISVLAMGFNMIGHQLHHLKVIEKMYLPLLGNKT